MIGVSIYVGMRCLTECTSVLSSCPPFRQYDLYVPSVAAVSTTGFQASKPVAFAKPRPARYLGISQERAIQNTQKRRSQPQRNT
jgi:hypothetical protein